jgi:competence protein ComEC
LLVTIKDSSAGKLCYGDELLIPAKYNAVEPPLNPAEFNYKQYLAHKNIYYQAFLYPKQYVLLKTNAGNQLIARSLRVRQHLVEKLKLRMHDTAAYAVASTIILGYKADLSEDTRQAFAATGTVHILSVSGAQVAIIYFILAFALTCLDRYKGGRFVRAAIIITVIWYYAMLTGFSLSVCRVSVMVSLVVAGKAFNRYTNTLNTLAISAFLLLLYDPFFITEVGFVLSYAAVSGIILLQPLIYNKLKFKNILADKAWALCSLTIAVQAAIFPISVYYFHQFPVYFLISNLFVIVPATAVMYLGILYLLLPQIPVISGSIAFVLEKIILILNKVLAFIEHAPYASINKLWLTTPEYLLLYTIVISLVCFLYIKKSWLIKLNLFCILLLCISLSLKNISLAGTRTIAWLNLNKHKGIVFKNGNEGIVLTDIKNTDKIYQYSVQPYLDSCGVSNVSVFNLSQDIKTPWLVKKKELIQCFNNRIYFFEGATPETPLQPKLKTDYIYITGNPAAAVNDLNANFDYRMLVIDGSNSDNLIDQIKAASAARGINYKILKRNNSFISVSK